MSTIDDDAAEESFDAWESDDQPLTHDFDDPLPMMRQPIKGSQATPKVSAQPSATISTRVEDKVTEEDNIDILLGQALVKNDTATFDTLLKKRDLLKKRNQQLEARHVNARVVFKHVGEGGDTEQRRVLSKYKDLVGKALPLLPGHDLTEALERMARRSPWLESGIQMILRSIRLGSHRAEAGFQLARPILLVGPPGIGKSWLVSQVRQRLGLPSISISAAGKTDNMALRGTARGWSSAREGDIVQMLAEKECANPLVVIDELDKVSPETRNGNLQQTLLQMFDPLNARQWRDEFLLGEVDLSAVSWLATANVAKDIIEPLLDRMDIIHLQCPRNLEERRLMLHSVAWDVADEHGLRSPNITEHPATWPDFIQDETLIQLLLESGNNFRIYRKILLGIMDRWLSEQKMHLM